MPSFDDDALILDHHPFRDRHLVVAALTRTHGVVRGVLRSARGGKIPLAGSVQVLSSVRLTFFRSPSAELATFSRVELVRSSFGLASDLRRSAAAAVVAELLGAFCPLDEPSPRSYRLGVAALEALLDGSAPDRVVAYVEFWVLQLGGLMPPPDALDGEPTADELAFLIACRRVPVADLDLDLPDRARQRLDAMVRANAERPLRALDFLRAHGE
ncbi:MAG: DNA repair protein RecO [Thermoanaerobaculales bacterium]|jgi:DNA repair protein RecO (recombination protein O)|nr:DNA repair protein RecO [Thermoanaerobaculales bacterium]